jgi:hypothetical protein
MAHSRRPTARSTSLLEVAKRSKQLTDSIERQGDRARQHRKPTTSAVV